MSKQKTGNNQYLKKLNQTAILDLIRVHKAISKSELSNITGLSPTATGVIVSGLLDQGYIHETGTGKSKGGRRPVLLELKPDSFFSVGVDLDVEYINTVLVDIAGNVINESSIPVGEPDKFEVVVARISENVKDILDAFQVSRSKLLGIGISIPGMVDISTRRVIFAPNLGWQDVDIKSLFHEFNDVPVYIENEAMSSAICENWIGECQDANDFVCINVKSGIGAGIFTGGKPYRGTSGSAGEVGHIVVDENGPRCGCGNYGCLETMASTKRMVENARKLVRQGTVSILNEYKDINAIGLDQVIEAAKFGDQAAKSVLMEGARYLGIAISNIINTLNPSKIVIGKEFVKYSDMVMEHLTGIAECKALKSPASKVEIKASVIGEKASTLGAAIIPLKALFGK